MNITNFEVLPLDDEQRRLYAAGVPLLRRSREISSADYALKAELVAGLAAVPIWSLLLWLITVAIGASVTVTQVAVVAGALLGICHARLLGRGWVERAQTMLEARCGFPGLPWYRRYVQAIDGLRARNAELQIFHVVSPNAPVTTDLVTIKTLAEFNFSRDIESPEAMQERADAEIERKVQLMFGPKTANQELKINKTPW